MNFAIELKRGISSEVYKFRGTLTLWLLILAPLFIPAINLVIFLSEGHRFITPEDNPWQLLIQNTIQPANLLFPFFVFIIALFVNSIEHNSNTWKLIYVQPLSRASNSTSKVIAFLSMILFSMTLFAIFTHSLGLLLGELKPEFGFDKAYDKSLIYQTCLKFFLGTIGFAAIQFWLSQRTKSILLPLGVGIAGFISFLILVQGWEYAEYHPYGYHALSVSGLRESDFKLWSNLSPVYRSLGLGTLVFLLAGWDQKRKRII